MKKVAFSDDLFKMVSAEGVQTPAEHIDFIEFFHISPLNLSHFASRFLLYRITPKSYTLFCPSQEILTILEPMVRATSKIKITY